MLSTSIVKNSGQAGHYYSAQDNYYSKDQGIQKSEWFGRGAEKLNLKGEVDLKQFSDLLNGKVPTTGEILGKKIGNEIKHRAGWDLTLSAPKSFSILALIGGHTRLLDVQDQAIKVTISRIEQDCVKARIKKGDEVAYEKTGNLVAALFHHGLSRSSDPQIHTHVVVMNMTERSDGKIRSMASQMGRYDQTASHEMNGFIERVRHLTPYYSKMYQSELAIRVKELGYEITTDTETGIFEIVGVSNEAIKHFSKRRTEIKKSLLEKGLSGGKAAQIATLDTRKNKVEINHIDLKEKWELEAKKIGLNCFKIIEDSKIKLSGSISTPSQYASQNNVLDKEISRAVSYAASSLSFFQTTFTLEDVVMASSDFMIQNNVNVDSILQNTDEKIQSGELILIPNERGKTVLMLRATIDHEKKIFESLSTHRLHENWIDKNKINRYLESNPQYFEFEHEIHSIFSNHPAALIDGKTAEYKLMKPILDISKKTNQEIIVISPSALGSKRFSKVIEQKPNTFLEKIKSWFMDQTPKHYSIAQFLSDGVQEKLSYSSPKLILVNHSEKLSTEQMMKLAEWNQKTNSKLILFGNKHTLESQKVGVSLGELAKQGVSVISLQARSETVTHHIDTGNFHALFEKLDLRIVNHAQEDDRHYAMVEHFSRLNEKERFSSWLVAHKRQTVHALNRATHEYLMKSQALGREEAVHVLVPVFIEEGRGKLAKTYPAGHVLRFNETYSSLKIERGEYVRILRNSSISNRVLLQKKDGSHAMWKPDRVAGNNVGKVELFKEEERKFSTNEIVIVSRSLKSEHLVKGERYKIISIHKNKLKLENGDGSKRVLDLSQDKHRHLDYGYASTLHHVATENPTQLIVDLPSKSFQANQRQFLQTISQPKEAWIYTDDANVLKINIEKRTGNRLSAHETLSASEEIKKSLSAFHDILKNEIIKEKGVTESKAISASIDAVDYAIRQLSEREAGFSQEDFMSVALAQAIGTVTETSLQDVLSEMKKQGVLIEIQTDQGILWTTAQALKTEQEIIALSTQDKDRMHPILDDVNVITESELSHLRAEQKDAVKNILTSYDRVIPLQGRAGTGKTTMMATLSDIQEMNMILETHGYSLHCIAPTHKAVKELKDRGLNAQTIDSFLMELKNLKESKSPTDFSRTILIVDESSMISNRNMLEVLKFGHEFDFKKIITAGDIKQNPSIESGKPYGLIQETLDSTIYLNDIQRQKNPILKKAAKELYENKVAQSFHTLRSNIIELSETTANDPSDKSLDKKEIQQKYYQQRVEAISKDYVSLLLKGEDVKIISPSHVDRKAVNEAVRNQLNQHHVLKGKEHSFEVYSSQDKTAVERSRASNFKIGNTVRFSRSSGKFITSGDYCLIKNIDRVKNVLILTHHASQKEIIWEIPQTKDRVNRDLEVFNKETRLLKVGDHIIWTKTNNQENVLSTDSSEVLDIDGSYITIKQKNGKTRTFNASDPKFKHWDHAYAITAYGAQGGTYSTILSLMETSRQKLTHLKNFLVIITRPVNELRIYTNSRVGLKESISRQSGDKLSAIELVNGEKTITKNQNGVPCRSPEKVPKANQAASLRSQKENTRSQVKQSDARTPRNNRSLSRYEMQNLKEKLNNDTERLAIHLLGEPKEKHSNYLKFGNNKGSLTLTTKGNKIGWFNDFSTNQGGRDMLKFIEIHGGMNRQDAIQFGLRWAGILVVEGEERKPKVQQNASRNKAKNDDKTQSAYEIKRIALANQIARESCPIKGTLAEKYLKAHRGIDLNSVQEDIRFHPKVYSGKNKKALSALIAIARNVDGKVQSVEAIFLDEKTANKADVPLQKQTIGVKKGALVTVNQSNNPNAPTLIAEGVVTGLSLAKALPNVNVRITLGKQNFININPEQLSKKVIFCLDNDGKNLQKDKLIMDASSRLSDKKEVRFMVPKGLNLEKQDYNDILKHKGVKAIQNDFQQSISFQNFFKSNQELSNPEAVKLAQISKDLVSENKNKLKKNVRLFQKINQENGINQRTQAISNQQISNSKQTLDIKDIDREI